MTDAAHTKAARPTLGALAVFIALVVLGGTAIGFLSLPGEWYAALEKPSFNPPNWIFGPIWSALYVTIAIVGWRSWTYARGSLAMKLWWAQLVMNLLWTPVFFEAHQIGAAFAVILILLALIIGFIATAIKRDRVAAWLFVPYAAWVGFASVLNGSIWMLN